MFTADVAVQDYDESTQDSCMLAHSQGTFCRVVPCQINITAPAVDLSRVPPQKATTTACILLHEPEKTKKITTTRTYSYSNLLVQR